MITLRADNRVLVQNAKFAYLTQNYSSNASIVNVSNTEPFSVGTSILLSEIGQTDAEVVKVYGISGTNITLSDLDNILTPTTYSHPESTRMIALQYDQIRFFWTPATGTIADETPVFNDLVPLTAWQNLDPSSYYSTYSDPSHSTGFGWFMYRNIQSGETSLESNPIPYVGFTYNTAQQVFADFESLLNTNELKLVSMSDKYAWLNEALAVLKNKLNLTNVEYTVSTPQTITTTSGTAEYMLPDDFSDVVEITDSNGKPIGFVPVSMVMTNNGNLPTISRYYLRGRYIGFSPTPTQTGTVCYYTYRQKATRITSLSTYIDLPDNAFYSLKDWMMYRAYMKFGNPLATAYYQSFKNAIDLYMQTAVKRSANLDTWEIQSSSNA
jgi:hypothetical protein